MKKSYKKQVSAIKQLEFTFNESPKCVSPNIKETKVIDFYQFDNYQRKRILSEILRSTKSF